MLLKLELIEMIDNNLLFCLTQISIRESLLKELDWKSVFHLSIVCKDVYQLKVHYDMIPNISWPMNTVSKVDILKEKVKHVTGIENINSIRKHYVW
jgi:hypothetical protein